MDDASTPVEKLAYIVSQQKLCSIYEEFLVSSLAWENFGFLLDVERYQELETKEERVAMAKLIFDKFLTDEALFSLGDIIPEVREAIYNRLEDAPPKLFNSLLRRSTIALAHATIGDFEECDLYKQFISIDSVAPVVELRFDHVYKVIVVGNFGVGKSAILNRFVKNKFDVEKKSPPNGPEFHCKTSVIESKAIKAQIWDTSGQEKFYTITKGYYRNAAAALLVYEVTEKESFNALDGWLAEIRAWCPDAEVCLVGNKADKGGTRKVTHDEGQSFAKDNDILLFYETSAEEGTHVAEAFTEVLRAVYKKYKVKGGVEYQFDQSRISLGEFEDDRHNDGCACTIL